MSNFKNDVTKLTLCGIAIFVFGIFIGFQLDHGMISSIQGYLFNASGYATDGNATNANATDCNATNANATNANATSANATNANATNANATSANATNANATSANATSANVVISLDSLFLKKFEISSKKVYQGDKVNVVLSTSDANVVRAEVEVSDGMLSRILVINNLNNNPYITIPSDQPAYDGYRISRLILTVDTGYGYLSKSFIGGSDFNINFEVVEKVNPTPSTTPTPTTSPTSSPSTTTEPTPSETTPVEEPVVDTFKLNNIKLEVAEAKANDKVKFTVDATKTIDNVIMVFTSSDNNSFTVYGKDLDKTNPYFDIPTNVVAGKYEMTGLSVLYGEQVKKYSNKDFSIKLEILATEEEKVLTNQIYNNQDISTTILADISDAPNGSVITVNANTDSFIKKEVFSAVRGKNSNLVISYYDNQIVFNGTDITDPKDIDARILVNRLSSNQNISNLVSNGLIVNFPSNGNLPGEAKVRIKESTLTNSVLNNKVYVYIYNEGSNNFCLISSNVVKNDGYYEFNINHNSDYVLVNKELDKSLVVSESTAVKQNENVVSFQKSDKKLLVIVGIAAAVLVVAVVAVVLITKKNKETI